MGSVPKSGSPKRVELVAENQMPGKNGAKEIVGKKKKTVLLAPEVKSPSSQDNQRKTTLDMQGEAKSKRKTVRKTRVVINEIPKDGDVGISANVPVETPESRRKSESRRKTRKSETHRESSSPQPISRKSHKQADAAGSVSKNEVNGRKSHIPGSDQNIPKESSDLVQEELVGFFY